MNHRFRNEEQNKYSQIYGNDLLYVSCCQVGSELQTQMPEFGMCPEEVYQEVADLLKWLMEKPKPTSDDLNIKWNRLYNNYLGFDRHVDKEEIRKAVCVVFAFACLALGSSVDTVFSLELSQKLIDCVAQADHACSDWAEVCDRIFDSCVLPEGWFDDMKNCDRVEISIPLDRDTCCITEIHNHFGKDSCRFEAGSTLNGDVIIKE